jgi:hypothetical protein
MYKLTNYETIIRLADQANIPVFEGNRDYVEYLEWLKVSGNVMVLKQFGIDIHLGDVEIGQVASGISVVGMTVAGFIHTAANPNAGIVLKK